MAVDGWLWKYVRQRELNNRNGLDPAVRARRALNTRRYRARLKAKPRNDLIAAVYWHEVWNPAVPIRQYTTVART